VLSHTETATKKGIRELIGGRVYFALQKLTVTPERCTS
jgi:hypothetical protein